ncbi:hypothetical protein LCGC14_1795640, partial [marine sediment metagenome]
MALDTHPAKPGSQAERRRQAGAYSGAGVRQALNKSPVVQIAVLGLGAVAVAILMLGMLGG